MVLERRNVGSAFDLGGARRVRRSNRIFYLTLIFAFIILPALAAVGG